MNNVVVSKIRVYNPNKKSSKFANKEYLKYIATRPGVDITQLDLEQKLENIYLNMSDDKKYLEYIKYRPKSHGLFGNTEIENLDNMANEMSALTSHGKIVYRGIVSLSKDDANELGYTDINKWNTMLKATMPDIANTFGISISSMKWVAAFHYEENHPHVHYMLWDTREKVASPYIHVSKQNMCREIFSKEIFQDERINHVIEKTVERDDILKLGKQIMEDSKIILSETMTLKVPKKINIEDSEIISSKLDTLVKMLPDKGRINYAFVPQEVKKSTDEIVNLIFERKDVKSELNSFLDHNEMIGRTYSASEEKVKITRQKALEDITRRISNIVLKTAKDLRVSYNQKVDNIALIKSEGDILNYKEKNSTSNFEERLTIFNKKVTFDNNVISESMTIMYDTNSNINERRMALTSLSKEAAKGNYNALLEIGKLYAQGIGVKKNLSIASNFFNQATKLYMHKDEDDNNNKDTYSDRDNYIESEEISSLKSDTLIIKHSSNKNNLWTDKYKQARFYLYGDKNHKPDFEQARLLFEEECENNNPLAAYELGTIYKKGLGIDIDDEKSDYYYKLSFKGLNEQNSVHATNYLQYKIGKMYMQGVGVDQDMDHAISYLASPADKGYKLAEYSLGKIYLDGIGGVTKDFEKAFELISSSASKGNIYAMYELGGMYEKGIGTDIDIVQSQLYYEDALKGFINSEHDRPEDNLQYRIAMMYYDGKGTNIDFDQAKHYLKKACESHNENAQYLLAKINLSSENNSEREEAISWLKESADKNNDRSQYLLAKLYLDKDYGLFDEERAIELLTKVCNTDNHYAKYTLGKCLLNKDSNHYDLKEALHYLKESAEFQNDYAAYQLGKVYLTDEYECKDLNKAFIYLKQAADLKNSWAQYTLGKLYLNKDFEHYDKGMGLKYIKESADQGNEYAQYYLGRLYIDKEQGLDNFNLGIEYLKLSCDQGNILAKYMLGKLYLNKDLLIYDEDKGINYLIEAANDDLECAKYTLAKIYLDKESKFYNDDKAYDLLKEIADDNDFSKYTLARLMLSEDSKYFNISQGLTYLFEAANNNNSYAQLELGKLYLYGKYLDKDKDKAEYWINKSLENDNPAASDFVKYRQEMEERYFNQKILGTSFKLLRSCFSQVNMNKEIAHAELEKQILRESRLKQKRKSHYNQNIERE